MERCLACEAERPASRWDWTIVAWQFITRDRPRKKIRPVRDGVMEEASFVDPAERGPYVRYVSRHWCAGANQPVPNNGTGVFLGPSLARHCQATFISPYGTCRTLPRSCYTL